MHSNWNITTNFYTFHYLQYSSISDEVSAFLQCTRKSEPNLSAHIRQGFSRNFSDEMVKIGSNRDVFNPMMPPSSVKTNRYSRRSTESICIAYLPIDIGTQAFVRNVIWKPGRRFFGEIVRGGLEDWKVFVGDVVWSPCSTSAATLLLLLMVFTK